MTLLRCFLFALVVAPLEALVLAGAAPRPALARSKVLRMQEAPPPPPSGSRLGGTVDQDGKSNVWAVEPSMKVEKTDKGIMSFAPVALVALTAVACVPLLPLLFAANPDQVCARSSHRATVRANASDASAPAHAPSCAASPRRKDRGAWMYNAAVGRMWIWCSGTPHGLGDCCGGPWGRRVVVIRRRELRRDGA